MKILITQEHIRLLKENIESSGIEYTINEKLSDEDAIECIASIDDDEVGVLNAQIILYDDFFIYEVENEPFEEMIEEIFDDTKLVCTIPYFSVNPNIQGLGVGNKLMTILFEYCKNNNISQFYLNACPMGNKGLDIKSLVRFYQKYGFKILYNQGNNVIMYTTTD